MNPALQGPRSWTTHFRLWSRRARLSRKLAYGLVVAAVLSGLATFATMTGTSPFGTGSRWVLFFLYIDAVLLLLLAAVIAGRIVAVWADRRRGMAGSRLHVRLVVLFSVVAVTPAILVAGFSGFYLNFGIQDWFAERVRTAVEESLVVAQAYLHEHRQAIRADAFAMANDLNREAQALSRRPFVFDQVISNQAAMRALPEAIVIDSNGGILARSQFSVSLELETIPPEVLAKADQGDVVVMTGDGENRVRAIIKLNRFFDAYLLVGRFVDARALERIDRTERAVTEYRRAESQREGFQITFVMIFALVALLLLLASVWIGLNVATQLAHPISALIAASERVRKGDLTARVQASAATDEIGGLSRAFNRMTSQLESQQQGLIEANRQLDERRRFTETVLAGVSAGVIGIDVEGRIHLPNRSASELLATDLEWEIGQPLPNIVPEMSELLEAAKKRPDRQHQAEIRLQRDGQTRTLLARVVGERQGADVIGWVVTFDDVTELLSAQRTAAWADVARRIAHEIKNPLTPIQLSAERLRRRYLKEISSDPETFSACTDTIIRQVGDIGRMVDEFSSFARMPEPAMKAENLSEFVREAVIFERNRHQDIVYNVTVPAADIHIRCDRQQVGRALTNILKNAAESVIARRERDGGSQGGHIDVQVHMEEVADGSVIDVVVEDDGCGLPAENRDRLTEPYVTTREKGTGLGLAIVKKIMEDHSGSLLLQDRPEGGARVTLRFRTTAQLAAVNAISGDEITRRLPGDVKPGNDDKEVRATATGAVGHGT